jgi:hypothetical protein
VILAAAGIVIGFLLLTSPAHADTGSLSGTLKKTTTTGLSKAGVGTVAKQATKTVRHVAKVTRSRSVTHKVSKPASVYRAAAKKAAPTYRAVRSGAQRAEAAATAARSGAKATARATKTTSKITAAAAKITPAGKITDAGKITAAAGKTAAVARDADTLATGGLLRPVADAGVVLPDAIQPVVQSVQTQTSQLHDRALAVLEDKIAQGIPGVVGGLGQIGDLLRPPVDLPGSGVGLQPVIAADSAQAPPGLLAGQAHPPSGVTANDITGSGLVAALGDLVSGLRQVLLLDARGSSSSAAVAVALLTVAAGVAAAGSATSAVPASMSLAFVEGGLLASTASRSRRLGGVLRQTGWRTPHRPSFSPD